ncbi:MAG: SDR family NAD(P)-dependent oxidoreductase [Polyangiales bacterium]
MTERKAQPDVAIIGMAGRFPGAPSLATFWSNVRDGVESIRRLGDEELLAAGVPREKLDDPSYVKACPVLEDIDKFDAAFFGFSPRDASVMDPAHRFFLEVSWEALEHAGYTGLPGEARVGVFAGAGAPLYMQENLRSNAELMRTMGDFLVRHTGNDMNFLATRVSYELDLRGPSMNVQTACSSSLAAVHLACHSLARGECELALAGGATVLVPMAQGYDYREGEILSPDGHCRPFDADSAGTVFGSGAGCVVLKLLERALDDGDTIHAVIKGSALNNDGSLKVGYLAPSVDGQAEVIDAALRAADVPADSIGYVETHGTGTLVGDPIELEGLRLGYGKHTDKRQFCAIGSLKSNIGHLGEAAGVASLIKATLALANRQLPPSLGYRRPNPQIDFPSTPFFVNTTLRDWTASGPLRCGVTALGAGGTNCHLILEQAPEPLPGEGARKQQLFVLSAKSAGSLQRASENLAGFLTQHDVDLADAAYTLALGRRPLPLRRIAVASSAAEAAASLRAHDGKLQGEARPREVVFMFPGGGAQYAGMGAELYAEEPVYREALDACLAIAQRELTVDLRALVLAPPSERERATRTLEQPSLTLPSLFATSYALARLLRSWGVEPVAYVGHSMGEYVAACLAEVLTLDEAMRLVLLRGRLFEQVAAGGMLSVPMAEAELRELMPATLSLAAVNGPEQCVVSGPLAELEALERTLSARELETRRVRIDVAAHSSMLEPILPRFRELCRTIQFRAPTRPIASNLTGQWLRDDEATDPEYWVRHLRNTVRFGDCIETVVAAGERVLLEVGPGRTLSTLARAQRGSVPALNSMRHPQEAASDLGYALTSLGRLWIAGATLDWHAFYEGQLRNRVPLPSYPFERTAFWVAPGKRAPTPDVALAKRNQLDDWFATPTWVKRPLLRRDDAGAQRCLVFSDGSLLARRLIAQLGTETLVATQGEQVVERAPRHWQLDFHSSNQHQDLLDALAQKGELPTRVVYLAPATKSSFASHDERLQRELFDAFFVPTFVARALGRRGEPCELSVITRGAASITDEPLVPLQALALGPVLVAPREFPQLRTRCIDLPLGVAHELLGELEPALLAELEGGSDVRLVALRKHARWEQTVEALKLPAREQPASWLREGGVYVLTGGLGGMALELASAMARKRRVRLALLARSDLPPESEWDDALAHVDAASLGARRIRAVRALRELGAEVRVIGCDIADEASLRAALERVHAELGRVHGVLHTAGVMDDEPMEERTLVSMQRVLEPKVQGTLLLDRLLDDELDFFVLFSSVASLLGLPGQVDYTAANAFLDAFAHDRARRKPGRTVVINWNAWRDVGMAASSHEERRHGRLPSSPCAHPALDGYSDDRSGRSFSTDFSSERHWLLSEHRIRGAHALLSGTTFVELARAAFQVGRAPAPVELADLTFTSPFQVPAGETRRLVIGLTPAGDAAEISMRTGGSDPRSPAHVVGDVRVYTGARPARIDLRAIAERCNVRVERPRDGFLEQDFVDFGPRWGNLVRVHHGVREALLELALPERFHAELAHYALHPALLDMATGGVQQLIPGFDARRDFYVPVRYGRLRAFEPLTAHVFSHVRCREETGDGSAYFDVSITDPEGRALVEIERFEMKRLEKGSAMTSAVAPLAKVARAEDAALGQILRHAIAPQEGVQAFERILAQPELVQCVASSVDVHAWAAQLAARNTPPHQQLDDDAGFARPTLGASFEPASTRSEEQLAQVWSQLLGIRQVGVRDDFFELGGNSLLAVRLFAAIKKSHGLSLPLSTLFEAPNIRALAELLDANAPAHQVEASSTASKTSGYSSLVPMQLHGDRAPFYCAAGMGGNPLNLRALAQLVGMGQPFYGLQPQGLDGNSQLHSSVPQMASYYIEQIKKHQPRGPYYLGGYSGGGVIAFEMAKQLVAAGDRVGALVFLDSPAPVLPMRTRRERLQMHAQRLRAQGPRYAVQTLSARAETQLRHALVAAQRPLAKLFPYHYRLENISNTWLEAAASYRPEPYSGDAMLFRAAEGHEAMYGTAVRNDHQNGWGPYVLGGIRVSVSPGDHTNLCEQPNVRVLARRVRAYLDERFALHRDRAADTQWVDVEHHAPSNDSHGDAAQ